MSNKLYSYFFAVFVLLFFLGCNEPEKPRQEGFQKKSFNKEGATNQFIKANQLLIQKESDEMDYYEKTHQLSFVKTNFGVRYLVYKPSLKGDSIKEGMEISMDYVVKLLSGEECYNSKRDGKKTFVVEHEQIESGIHKGIQLLKRGDKAILLIPSYLAHGLLGDMNKIPPQMPIVYEVSID